MEKQTEYDTIKGGSCHNTACDYHDHSYPLNCTMKTKGCDEYNEFMKGRKNDRTSI